MDTVNTDMLRGRVDIIVLNALSEKDGYGYDILNYIHTKTEGHYEMKQSSIYSVLKRLEKSGYVSSYAGGEETNGAKRRYYTLTNQGKEVLENEKKEWSYTRTLINNLVSSDAFDLKNDTPPFKPSDLRPLTKRINVSQLNEESDQEEPAVAFPVADSAEEDFVDEKSETKEKYEKTVNIDTNDIDKKQEIFSRLITTSETIAAKNIVEPKIKIANSINSATDNLYSQKQNTVDKVFTKSSEKQSINQYKDVLSSIFSASNNTQTAKNEKFEDIDCKYIYDLKAVLKNEGYRLKEYSPTANKSIIKYVLSNKLLRDSVFLSFLFYVITILALFLARNAFEISKNALLVAGGMGLIMPIAALIMYYQNPVKKKKDVVNIKLILNICLIVYLAAFMINLIIALILPSGYSLNSLHIYAPCVVLFTIPFFGIIFTTLYKSGKYHLS